MHPHHWFETVFGSRSRIRVLRALAEAPDRAWSVRDLARASGMSPNTVARTVEGLHRHRIIAVRVSGASYDVQLRTRLDVVQAMIQMFQAERAMEEAVYARIREAAPAGSSVYLFGSTARGTADGDSDVDLLVVAPDAEEAEKTGVAVWQAASKVMPARFQPIPVTARALRGSKSKFFVGVRRDARLIGGKEARDP